MNLEPNNKSFFAEFLDAAIRDKAGRSRKTAKMNCNSVDGETK